VRSGDRSPARRAGFGLVAAMVTMIAVPAALTLHTVRISSVVDVSQKNPSPFGYTVSLLLFLVPIVGIGFWFVPQEGVRISKKAFWWTVGLLFPVGAALDFLFAHIFFTFPNPQATLGWRAPALHGTVPVEEYLFYFFGFVAVLLMYVWLDEYWLRAYTVSESAPERVDYDRLLGFHPWSALLGAVLIVAALVYKRFFSAEPEGFPGYWTFLVVLALAPSSAVYGSARKVVNWRAFSLTFFIILLTSLMWEATLALPYGWWGFQGRQMMGLRVTAWAGMPVEEVAVWMSVTFTTVLVYEVVKRWQASGKPMRRALMG
jgi:Lycopene cyclase